MNDEIKRIPPNDFPSETAFLGSCFLNPTVVIPYGIERLDPTDFFDDSNKEFWNLLVEMFNDGTPIDPVIVRSELTRRGKLEAVGGVKRIVDLFQKVPNVAHATYYLKRIIEMSMLRRIIELGSDALTDAYDEATDGEGLLQKTENRLMLLRAKADKGSAVKTVETTKEVAKRIEVNEMMRSVGLDDVSDPGATRVVSTPFGSLSLALAGGARTGELVLIAARPSHGKTALAVNWHDYIVHNGGRSLFICLEMSSDDLVTRCACNRGRVNLLRQRAGTLDRESVERFDYSLAQLKSEDGGMFRTRESSFAKIVATIKQQHLIQRLDIVFIDYLQLMELSGNQGRSEKIGQMTRSLKLLAMNLNVPIVLLSQVNRESGNSERPPKMSELRESGSIEQDADTIIVIHRSSMYKTQNAEHPDDCSWLEYVAEERKYADVADVIVEKNRNGARTHLQMLYFGEWVRFAEREEYDMGTDEERPF
jgi:replicative DNA helicase